MPSQFKCGFFGLLCFFLLSTPQVYCQTDKPEKISANPQKVNTSLSEAVMCEEIRDSRPRNAAAVFSLSLGKVCCYTLFDPVSHQTEVYHSWYKRDKLSTKIKLELQPPRWATFSRIQSRESDKGPWRVEISDAKGNLIQVLRFSITD